MNLNIPILAQNRKSEHEIMKSLGLYLGIQAKECAVDETSNITYRYEITIATRHSMIWSSRNYVCCSALGMNQPMGFIMWLPNANSKLNIACQVAWSMAFESVKISIYRLLAKLMISLFSTWNVCSHYILLQA